MSIKKNELIKVGICAVSFLIILCSFSSVSSAQELNTIQSYEFQEKVQNNMDVLDSFVGLKNAKARVKRENPSWSIEKLDAAFLEYKKWLILKKHFGLDVEYPMLSNTVDSFWHAHILYTKLYMVECDKFFNEYLHHTPYTESDPEKSKLAIAKGIEKFKIFKNDYEQLFGHQLASSWDDAVLVVQRANQ